MALTPPTNEYLTSVKATKPLTEWLIHAAKSHRTLTYGQVKRRLEEQCGFDVIFTISVGKVAGATMNAILDEFPDAPLLNVLLVRVNSGLPGLGVVGYLATRYPGRRWLRGDSVEKHTRWRELVEYEATRVYEYKHWDKVYRQIYGRRLPAIAENLKGSERDIANRGRGGEGENHRSLRLKVKRNPGLVRPGLRPENTKTEVELYSGDRVDVVSNGKTGRIAIEVKSRDSNRNDLRRGVYQCVKYRAVMAAEDMRRTPKIETWLVTETELPADLRALAHRLDVRTKVIKQSRRR